MPSVKKIKLKEEYLKFLGEYPNFLLTRYQGATVGDLSELRGDLRKFSLRYRVVKNRILIKAFRDFYGEKIPFDPSILIQPIGIIFSGDILPTVAKTVDVFGKKHKSLKIFGAFLEGRYFSEVEVSSILNLSTKEEMLAVLARTLNSPAVKISGTMQNIIVSLARAIRSVGEQN